MSFYRGKLFNHYIAYDIPNVDRRIVMDMCIRHSGTGIVYDESFTSEMERQYGPSPKYDCLYETLLKRERFQELLDFIITFLKPSEDRVWIYLLNAIDHNGELSQIFLGLATEEDHPPVDGLYA